MTVRELIDRLQDIERAGGPDLGVRVADGEGYWPFGVTVERVGGMPFVQLDTTAADDDD